VVVDDAEFRHDHGHDLRLLFRPPLHAQPPACVQPVGFAECRAVQTHATCRCHLRGERAGETQPLRQARVYARNPATDGNGQQPALHRQSFTASATTVSATGLAASLSEPTASESAAAISASRWSFSRVPSKRSPSTTRRATATIPQTMKMSAIL